MYTPSLITTNGIVRSRVKVCTVVRRSRILWRYRSITTSRIFAAPPNALSSRRRLRYGSLTASIIVFRNLLFRSSIIDYFYYRLKNVEIKCEIIEKFPSFKFIFLIDFLMDFCKINFSNCLYIARLVCISFGIYNNTTHLHENIS